MDHATIKTVHMVIYLFLNCKKIKVYPSKASIVKRQKEAFRTMFGNFMLFKTVLYSEAIIFLHFPFCSQEKLGLHAS